ncbi:MAG: hypothetical protein ACSLEL_00745 [Candidatus Malihini olakiniferum]
MNKLRNINIFERYFFHKSCNAIYILSRSIAFHRACEPFGYESSYFLVYLIKAINIGV